MLDPDAFQNSLFASFILQEAFRSKTIALTAIIISFFAFGFVNTICRVRVGNTEMKFRTAVEQLPRRLESRGFGNIQQAQCSTGAGSVLVTNGYLH